MKQKLNCILLPTEQRSRLVKSGKSEQLMLAPHSCIWELSEIAVQQNLFLVSSEEIEEGNWVIAIDTNTIFKCNKYEAEGPIKQFKDIYLKIIASTNGKELGLPTINTQSLELYVKHQPSEVYIEMKEFVTSNIAGNTEKALSFQNDIITHLEPKLNSCGEKL